MRRSRLAPLVALLPVLCALAACTSQAEEGEPLPVGMVLDEYGTLQGERVFVNIPTGRLDFVVGAPSDDLPIYDDTYTHAADDASIIGVSWTWDFRSRFASMADPRTNTVEPHVSLVADGRAYSLDEALLRSLGDDPSSGPALDFFGTAWVGVDGEPSNLALRVEFDGFEQEVEVGDRVRVDDNAATGLYRNLDALARRTIDCGPPSSGGRALPEGNGLCLVEVADVPYHPAVGWATTSDDSWLVVRSRLLPDEFRSAPGACGPGELGEVTYRLDGAEPAVVEKQDVGEVVTGRDLVIFASASFGGPRELVMRAEMSFPTGDCAPKQLTWRERVY